MSWWRVNPKLARPVRGCVLGILVMALALVAADNAQASCGDYVLVRDASGKLVPASQLTAEGQATAEHSSAPMERPCRGPECSQLPMRPPAVPTVPIHWPSAPEAALEQGGDGSDRPESDQPQTSSGPLHPIHHPGGIFRPPR